MRLLPVVERELRVRARNRRLYWGRTWAGAVAMAVLAWMLSTFGHAGGTATKAQIIFVVLAVLIFSYSALAGIFLTADSIAEEKREGTLGLLFLTNLKGYDVALGKLVAHSCQAITGLLAVIPILAIPLMLGGVTQAEVWRVTLVQVTTLLLSLACGLLLSAACRRERMAQFGTFVLLLLVMAGPPVVGGFLLHELKLQVSDLWFAVSPGYALWMAFGQFFPTRADLFWKSLGFLHALTWIAFLAAAFLVRRSWQDRPATARAGGWFERLRAKTRGSRERQQAFRTALLRINPYYWLVARHRWKRYSVLLFLAGCALLWILLALYYGRDMIEQETLLLTSIPLHLALKFWIASEAVRQFNDDRKNNAFELTLSTPLPVPVIIEGQFRGLVRQFGPEAGLIILLDLTAMVIGTQLRFGGDMEWIAAWCTRIVVLVADLLALGFLGMWLGLTVRRSSLAVAQTLSLVLFVPWLSLLGIGTFIALFRIDGVSSFYFFLGTYAVLSLLIDAFLVQRAVHNLSQKFRALATTRFESTARES